MSYFFNKIFFYVERATFTDKIWLEPDLKIILFGLSK